MKRTFLFLLLLLKTTLLFSQDEPIYDDHLVLKKWDEKVFINYGTIGITTQKDTVVFNGQKELSYEIFKLTPDSIILFAPLAYHQVTVESSKVWDVLPSGPYKSKYIKSFKKNRVRYYTYLIIDSIKLKSFSYKEILSISYPPHRERASVGCMGCAIIMFIPPINIIYFLSRRSELHTKTYVLSKWQLTFYPKKPYHYPNN